MLVNHYPRSAESKRGIKRWQWITDSWSIELIDHVWDTWHHHYSRCMPQFIINENIFHLPFSCLTTTCIQCTICLCTTHSRNQYEPHLPMFSPTHFHPHANQDYPSFTQGILLFLPSSLFVRSVHVYFCHCLTLLRACVHTYYSNHVTCTVLGLDQPHTLLGHTSLVIFHSHHLILVLAKTIHPARLCLPASLAQRFWIMRTHHSWWVCVVQVQSVVMFFCIKSLIILSEQ